MKIAAKTPLATLAVVMGMGACLLAGTAMAQTTSGSAGALPPGLLTSPSSAADAAAPSAPAAATHAVEAPSPAALAKTVGVPSLNAPVGGGAGGADVRIPDSVKGVVKKLSTETGDVTVEDLNEARQAVAKLDLLLDIEKRMSDLTLLRMEREEKKNAMLSTNSIAGALPASALGLGALGKGGAGAPPNLSPQMLEMMKNLGLAPVGQAAPAAEKEKEKPPTSIEVDRVIGAAGKYTAILRVGTDKAKQVKVGDKLSDGSVVESISSQGVVVSDTKKGQRTIQVRDVNTIFGAR